MALCVDVVLVQVKREREAPLQRLLSVGSCQTKWKGTGDKSLCIVWFSTRVLFLLYSLYILYCIQIV